MYVCVSAAKDDIAAAMAGGIAFMSLEDMKAELGLSESEYNRQVSAVGRLVPWARAKDPCRGPSSETNQPQPQP